MNKELNTSKQETKGMAKKEVLAAIITKILQRMLPNALL